jgi:hypothetical protein
VVKKYWRSEWATWSHAGFEFDDLLQLVRIKLLQVPAEVVREKGIGYKVRIISNYLNDQLKKLRAQKNSREDQLIDLLNEEHRGKAEHGESGVYNVGDSETAAGVDLSVVEEKDKYLTTSQKLAGIGYRIKRIRKPIHLQVIYDVRYPRKYHRCLVLGRWLILDVMANQDDYVSRHGDVGRIKERLRQRKERERLPLSLTLKGSKQDVTDYPIPRRLTDKDRRMPHRDPITKGEQQHRTDFFEDFF